MTRTTDILPPSGAAIDKFIRQWTDGKMELYSRLAKAVENACREALESKGITNVLIKCRPKDPVSLQDKLRKYVHEGKIYNTPEEVEQGVVDLAGAQISTDDPGQFNNIDEIIRNRFNVDKDYKHPKQPSNDAVHRTKVFIYEAHHYHVQLKPDDPFVRNLEHATEKLIEIQVMTTAMRVTASYEHDRGYKAKKEPNSTQETILMLLSNTRIMYDEILSEGNKLEKERKLKDNKDVNDLDYVGHRLKKRIQATPNAWFTDKGYRSAKPVLMYLEKSDQRARADFDQLLEEHLQPGFEFESAYNRLAEMYKTSSLDLVVYLMDRLLLDRPNGTGRSAPVDPMYKIEVMMSTLVWLCKLFEPRLEWLEIFVCDYDRKALHERLMWLRRSKKYLVKDPPRSLEPTDIKNLDALWQWFEQHTARQIRLAFAMSNHGMIRKIMEIDSDLDRLIHMLGVGA